MFSKARSENRFRAVWGIRNAELLREVASQHLPETVVTDLKPVYDRLGHSFPHYRIQMKIIYAAVVSVLLLKAFQGISKLIIFNHEDIPSLQSLAPSVKSLVTAVEDLGEYPKPDSVTAKDFPLLIMGYYIMKLEKSRVSDPKRGGKNGKT